MATTLQVGVDIGGTFTDLVASDGDGNVVSLKISSTRGAEGRAVQTAVSRLLAERDLPPQSIARFVHGTTVATNAVLERKGAKTGLLTTEGFRDILQIGRQNRTSLYDLFFQSISPTFLVAGALRQEVRERIGPDGAVVTPLDVASLHRAIDVLLAEGVEAIAVCFLFSFVDAAHERIAREVIGERAPDVAVSLSCEVDPFFREYERTCTTAFDAYVKPRLRGYLAAIAEDLAAAGVPAAPQIMQSRGGVMGFATALQRPGRLFLSGPAAGVIGGQMVGERLGIGDLITIDIGGTSCDIALIAGGRPGIRSEGLVDGYVVRVPMVDVNAIGAGGGSIAWINGAGGLRVGPHSAGAVPGPACYGTGGTEATVTDASIVLGYIDPGYFAGGTMQLRPELAATAIAQTIAGPLGLSVEYAALGIHRVVNGQMAEGIRLVSVKRGIDPRGFTLMPLGGGGGMHAAALAEELGMTRIVVPLTPGVLSAMGLLAAPLEHELSAVYYRPLHDASIDEIGAALAELDRQCHALMQREDHVGEVQVSHFADLSYVGQSYFLEVPVGGLGPATIGRLYDDFLAAHHRVYGHSMENPARVVNLRSVHRAAPSAAVAARPYQPSGKPPQKPGRSIVVGDGGTRVQATVWDRTALPVHASIAGPAILEQSDTTTLIPPGWSAQVGSEGSLMMTKDIRA
jgi:N-methylhydantoinase A/oxoprolinase/acetone carboxylase beta subunit